jgi:hypothetical protein
MITLFVADDVVAVVVAVVSDRRQSGAIDLGNRIAKRLGMRDVFEGLSIVHMIICMYHRVHAQHHGDQE